MYTCKKTYSDIPFAHRQHLHDGHCAFIHGHNWSFTFTFGCHELDECGFVVDFGKLKPLREWIDDNLDHACVFNAGDPMLETFQSFNDQHNGTVFKVYVVDCCSSEGLAKHLFEKINSILAEMTAGRAYLIAVEVIEDQKNSATYQPTIAR